MPPPLPNFQLAHQGPTDISAQDEVEKVGAEIAIESGNSVHAQSHFAGRGHPPRDINHRVDDQTLAGIETAAAASADVSCNAGAPAR